MYKMGKLFVHMRRGLWSKVYPDQSRDPKYGLARILLPQMQHSVYFGASSLFTTQYDIQKMPVHKKETGGKKE